MIKECLTPKDVVDFLNSLAEEHPEFLNSFFRLEVMVEKELADHPTIQATMVGDEFGIRPLGFINGMFGIREEDGWGPIMATVDSETENFMSFRLSPSPQEIVKLTEELENADMD